MKFGLHRGQLDMIRTLEYTQFIVVAVIIPASSPTFGT